MLEKLKNHMADVSDITAKEFRLVINTCWDIYGDNTDKNCIHMNTDEKKKLLDTMYVDVMMLSSYFHQGTNYYT